MIFIFYSHLAIYYITMNAAVCIIRGYFCHDIKQATHVCHIISWNLCHNMSYVMTITASLIRCHMTCDVMWPNHYNCTVSKITFSYTFSMWRVIVAPSHREYSYYVKAWYLNFHICWIINAWNVFKTWKDYYRHPWLMII